MKRHAELLSSKGEAFVAGLREGMAVQGKRGEKLGINKADAPAHAPVVFTGNSARTTE